MGVFGVTVFWGLFFTLLGVILLFFTILAGVLGVLGGGVATIGALTASVVFGVLGEAVIMKVFLVLADVFAVGLFFLLDNTFGVFFALPIGVAGVINIFTGVFAAGVDFPVDFMTTGESSTLELTEANLTVAGVLGETDCETGVFGDCDFCGLFFLLGGVFGDTLAAMGEA